MFDETRHEKLKQMSDAERRAHFVALIEAAESVLTEYRALPAASILSEASISQVGRMVRVALAKHVRETVNTLMADWAALPLYEGGADLRDLAGRVDALDRCGVHA